MSRISRLVLASLFILVAVFAALWWGTSRYLRNRALAPEIVKPPLASPAAPAGQPVRIVAGKVLVRFTPDQARAAYRALETSGVVSPSPVPEPSPASAVSPSETPAISPAPSSPEVSASPSPASSASPAVLVSSSPLLSPSDSPTEAGTPQGSPTPEARAGGTRVAGGRVRGAQLVLPELAALGDLLEDVEPVTPLTVAQESVIMGRPLSSELRATALLSDTRLLVPAERWFALDLAGEESVVTVENLENLRPVLSTRDAHGKQTPVTVSHDAQTALTKTRDVLQRLAGKSFERVEPALAFSLAAPQVPSDPYFASSGSWQQPHDDLWGLKRIQAPAAWEKTTGSTDTVIAIVDTGVDLAHRDLAGNLWTNAGEEGTDAEGQDKKSNGVDDDGNGYVDDWRGWDFGDGDNDPQDDAAVVGGHGTHVAGIIAATGNNSVDITGVLWRTQIIPLKAWSTEWGDAFSDDLAAALRYAADHGTRVLNASWGGWGHSAIIRDAVDYVREKGVLVVVAAGNDGEVVDAGENFLEPASEDGVIAVSAITPADTRWKWSNHGPKIELAAPGGKLNDDDDNFPPGILSLRASGTSSGTPLDDFLMLADGTSMAAPYVSGVAGLVFSLHPDWTADQVRQRLVDTADDLGTSGRDEDFGFGLVNAARAVEADSVSVRLGAVEALNADGQGSADLACIPYQDIRVSGVAEGAGLVGYRVELSNDLATGESPTVWTSAIEQSAAPSAGVLGTWNVGDTMAIAEDRLLRLTVNPDTLARIQVLRRAPLALRKKPSVVVNRNETQTTSRQVTLTLWMDVVDETAEMRIRNGGDMWGPWEPYTLMQEWILPLGDGAKTVEAQFRRSGQESAIVQDMIALQLDPTLPPVNAPPIVSAGQDVTVNLADAAALLGATSDDGLPEPPGTVTATWSAETAPGTVTFANPHAPATQATFDTPGAYVLRLSATDGEETAADDVTVTVRTLVTPSPSAESPIDGGDGGDSGGGGGDSGGGSGDSGGGGGGGEESGGTPTPRSATAVKTIQAETGKLLGKYTRVLTENGQRITRVAGSKDSATYTVSVPLGTYTMSLRAKQDKPAPVRFGIDINGKRWKVITLAKDSNQYGTVTVGQLKNFRGGTVTFRLLNDVFDRRNPLNADADRNFEFDWFRFSRVK